MSLRYKALIAVVALVAALTGALAWSSGQRFEEDARERIERDLEKDAQFLNAQIKAASRSTITTLRGSLAGGDIALALSRLEGADLGDNLLVFIRDWLVDTDADIALIALDDFVADEREAANLSLNTLFSKKTDLAVSAFHDNRTKDPTSTTTELLNDPILAGFVGDFYARLLDSDAPDELDRLRAAVLPVAGAVHLVVQAYVSESAQRLLGVGVGVVMFELSEEWIARFLPGSDDARNPVEKLVFTGDLLTASTLADAARSQQIFREALGTPGTTEGIGVSFEIMIDGETFLGLTLSSDLAPADMPNRPGFIAVKSLDRELAPFLRARRELFAFAAGLAILAAALAYFGAYLVISKLRRLQDATIRIRKGDFNTTVRVAGRDELARLGKAFNDMTSGLKALGMYTHETLARGVLENPQLLGAYSARDEGSIFFTDIKGFTSIAETMPAEALTAQLNEYFAALGVAIADEKGYVDKFIGDSVMAFWGLPFIKEGDYAVRACRAALRCLAACAELREQWKAEGRPLFFQRIGIATGEAIVGNIGTDTKKNFTVIGDSVNLASRLEGTNKLYGTEILVDQRTAELVRDVIPLREVDQIRVVGRVEPVRVYEPLPGEDKALAAYGEALGRYRGADFAGALRALEPLLQARPEDGPAKWLQERCEKLLRAPPGLDWEPVTTAETK